MSVSGVGVRVLVNRSMFVVCVGLSVADACGALGLCSAKVFSFLLGV